MAGTPQQCKPITVGPLYNNNTHNNNLITHTHSTWTEDY